MKVDCSHPRARHLHGTRNAYVLDRCRCDDCRAAATAYERRRVRDRLYGRAPNLVDAEPVRDHLRRLAVQGMGMKRVADAAGVAYSTITPILYGRAGSDPTSHRPPRKRIRRDTADRILAVRLDLAPHTPIPSTGTVRRLQALVAVGWSLSRLAPRLGMLPANLHTLVDRDQVLQDTAVRVAALYDELWDQPPPQDRPHDLGAYRRALGYARARGWLPPLAWDDDTIDDPAWTPATAAPVDDLDEIAIWRRMQGDRVKVSNAEASEVVRRLAAAGVSWSEIERRTRINPGRHQDRSEAS